MPDRANIPHLLTLLDDDSDFVRENVQHALLEYGPYLEKDLIPFYDHLNEQQAELIVDICSHLREQEFEATWLNWLDQKHIHKALEQAMSRLAYLEYGYSIPQLEQYLNELAHTFMFAGLANEPSQLMTFVFDLQKFGPPQGDHHHPRLANLLHVIRTRQGDQTSLGILCMLLGCRLGIQLYGLSLPDTFLLVSYENNSIKLYDPYDEGAPMAVSLTSEILENIRQQKGPVKSIHSSTEDILLDVLRTRINRHKGRNEYQQMEVYVRKFETLMFEIQQRTLVA
ncbi:MAG: transglutaminase family protein [Bacteroidota bacterium]